MQIKWTPRKMNKVADGPARATRQTSEKIRWPLTVVIVLIFANKVYVRSRKGDVRITLALCF
jgi:hypothetical protein